MIKPKFDKLFVLTAAFVLGLTLVVLTGKMAAHARESQTELLLLAQQISQQTGLVAAESKGLLSNSQSLAAMQQANDQNIAAFQLLINGSVKRDLPSYDQFLGELPASAATQFTTFQTTVSELTQSRSLLERLLQGKDALIQSAERLANQADAISDGVEQQSNSLDHLRSAYRLKTILIAHSQAIKQAYAENASAPVLPLTALNVDLKALSTDPNAPVSPAIRRSAVNLLNQLEEHQKQLTGLSEHNQASVKLRAMQEQLLTQARNLQQQMEVVATDLYSYTPFPLYLSIILAFISLGLAIMVGYHSRGTPLPASQLVAESTGAPASEHTKPNFLIQLKTEKNILMNDIKPIGDGILYIKADEHMESTGDLARCLNQSREALVRRIEQLKRQVVELQDSLNQDMNEELTTTVAPQNPPTQNSPLIDLTFKGHAELDGLQRQLRNQPSLDQEHTQLLLSRCIRVDIILDEIRVRLQKSGYAEYSSIPSQGVESITPAFEKISGLVSKLVENLEEFQTQPSKSRKARNLSAV